MKTLKISILALSILAFAQTTTDVKQPIKLYTQTNPALNTITDIERMITILASLPYTAHAIDLADTLHYLPIIQSEEIQEWLKNAKARLVNGPELYAAAWHYGGDKLKVQKLLKNKDIDLNWRAYEGITALMSAGSDHLKEIVELLLKAGANPNLQDEYGETALTWTIKNTESTPDAEIKKKEIITLLLDAGADPNLKNKRGKTALMLAALEGYKEIMELLLSMGANC